MFTIIILALSLILFFANRKKESLALFAFMATRYLNVVPPQFVTLDGSDAAVVYMIIMLVFYRRKPVLYTGDKKLKSYILIFILFVGLSWTVSLFYYDLSIIDCFMGSRSYFLALSYFFIRKIDRNDILYVFKVFYYITLIHSALYIVQVLTDFPILGVTVDTSKTSEVTYLNLPLLALLYLPVLIFFENKCDFKFKRIAPFIILGAIFCTQGRTLISMTILCLILGALISGKSKIMVKLIGIVAVAIIPFATMVLTRIDNEGDTQRDISALANMDFVEYAQSGRPTENSGTMTYRLAWVYERAEYMLKTGITESVFGLGLFAPQNFAAKGRYKFRLGLPREELGGFIDPVTTPDISYGNLIASLGFVGTFFYLMMWIAIVRYSIRRRYINIYYYANYIYCTSVALIGLSGQYLSMAGFLIIPFCIFSLSNQIRSEL